MGEPSSKPPPSERARERRALAWLWAPLPLHCYTAAAAADARPRGSAGKGERCSGLEAASEARLPRFSLTRPGGIITARHNIFRSNLARRDVPSMLMGAFQ